MAMIGPAVAILVLLLAYPLVYSFWLSLQSYNIVRPPRFVGLDNYIRIFSDPVVLESIKVTFVFAISSFALQFVIGFGLALLLDQQIRGRNLFRTLMVVPLMLTPVVVGINFRLMLNYDFGIVNWFFGLFGVPKAQWVTDPLLAMVALVAVEVWHETPFCLLIFSAGLTALPSEPLEAAEVDGANWWQKIWYVIIPIMLPLFLIVALFRSYSLLRVYDLVFAITAGGPGRATETLSYLAIEQLTVAWKVGYSAAISYVLFGISLLVSLVFIRSVGLRGQVD